MITQETNFFVTDAGLREIKTYAHGIGPWKRYIVSPTAAGLPGPGEASRKLLPAGDLIERAHKVGLLVHTWTFCRALPHWRPRRLAALEAGLRLNKEARAAGGSARAPHLLSQMIELSDRCLMTC
jgi:hypothetical protein